MGGGGGIPLEVQDMSDLFFFLTAVRRESAGDLGVVQTLPVPSSAHTRVPSGSLREPGLWL